MTNEPVSPACDSDGEAVAMIEYARRQAEQAALANVPSPPSLPADSFPGYQLVEEIHRGGQGVVYRATHAGTKREVALKVMRAGPFASAFEKARFEREIEILGKLKHPGVVAIHDGGVASGHRFFVMDYIAGRPLDAHVAVRSLTIEQALRLFLKTCDAVQAAHLRGVVHRDLKPANVRIDEEGEPHVLDFGLANWLPDGEAGMARNLTVTGQFVGSLPWASPEQVLGRCDNLDIRTDVYSLGVILFQMLTRSLSYALTNNPRETIERIAAADPRRPSSLRAEIGLDLDTIVLKCLEKPPERRYQSVAELSEDVRRYLEGEPILARMPSTAYLVRKLVSRHRVTSSLLALLCLAVVAFSLGISILYSMADAARRRATQAEAVAKRFQSDAERQAKTAEAVTNFLINDVLAAAEPAHARGANMTVKEAFANAAQRLSTTFVDDPLLRASVLARVGEVYRGLGLDREALAPLREADSLRTANLGDLDPATLEVRRQLLNALLQSGEYTEAAPIAETLHTTLRNRFGEDHDETLRAAGVLAQAYWFTGRVREAIDLHHHLYDNARRSVDEGHPAALHALSQWAVAEFVSIDGLELAEETFRPAVEASRARLGADHPDTLRLMTLLAMTVAGQRRFFEADELLDTVLKTSSRVLGEDHLDHITATVHRAILREQQGRLSEAEALCRSATAAAKAKLGDEHPTTLWAMDRLGHILGTRGDAGAGLQIHKDLLEIRRRLWGENDLTVANAYDGVGLMLFKLERFEEAVVQHRRALEIVRGGPDTSALPAEWTLRCLMRALGAAQRNEEARPIAEELLDFRRQKTDSATRDAYALNAYAVDLLTAHPSDLRDPALALEYALKATELTSNEYDYNRYTVGLAYEALGDLEEAARWVRRALAFAPLESSESRTAYETALVRILERLGDDEAAEAVYRETLTRRRLAFPPGHPDIAASLDELGELLIQHGELPEAEASLRESAAIRSAVATDEDWRLARTQSLLGAALLAQSRNDEGEPLLREAVDQLRRSDTAPVSVVRNAEDRLRGIRSEVPPPPP